MSEEQAALRQSHFASGWDAGRQRCEQENARLLADCAQLTTWAKDEQAKREAAEDARVQARSEAAYMQATVSAARAFVEWHLRGQSKPRTPDSFYPMTYGELDKWQDEREARLRRSSWCSGAGRARCWWNERTTTRWRRWWRPRRVS